MWLYNESKIIKIVNILWELYKIMMYLVSYRENNRIFFKYKEFLQVPITYSFNEWKGKTIRNKVLS